MPSSDQLWTNCAGRANRFAAQARRWSRSVRRGRFLFLWLNRDWARSSSGQARPRVEPLEARKNPAATALGLGLGEGAAAIGSLAIGDVDGDGLDDLVMGAASEHGPMVMFSAVMDLSPAHEHAMFPFDGQHQGSARVALARRDDGGAGMVAFATLGANRSSSQVKALDLGSGTVLAQWSSYHRRFADGVFLAAGDLDGDGIREIVTAPGGGANSAPLIRVFDADGQRRSQFLAFDEAYRGGVTLAVGDVDGDGRGEIITARSQGGHSFVRVFEASRGRLIGQFHEFATDPPPALSLAAADLDGDGRDEILVSSSAGGATSVKSFQFIASSRPGEPRFQAVGKLLVSEPGDPSSVTVATADIDGDGLAEIIAAGRSLRMFHGRDGRPMTPPPISPAITVIAGQVEDTAGRVVEGALVQLGRHVTQTEADGSFAIVLDPARGDQFNEDFPIKIPTGEPLFDPGSTGAATIALRRAVFDPTTGTDPANPRRAINLVTSFLDGSAVYGSDTSRALALRALDGGGRLKTGPAGLLPLNTPEQFPGGLLTNDNDGPFGPFTLFAAGDTRASENLGLAVVHTILVREHNRLADQFHTEHPDWTDERIYQEARRFVSAIIQHITYEEFLPALLGSNGLPAYQGYNPVVDPRVSPLFSAAAFRVGHTLFTPTFPRLDASGESLPGGPIDLQSNFFDTSPIARDGIEPYLRGAIATIAEEIDNQVIDGLRNFLFGAPGAGGMDLASLNIQRGRDMGLPDYNSSRVAVGLPRVSSFDQITSNSDLQHALEAVYGSIDRVDPWVGGLCEDHAPGSAIGPFFSAVIRDQFQRARDGDRFWYQNGQFTADELAMINSSTLGAVIERTTNIQGLRANVLSTGSVSESNQSLAQSTTRPPSSTQSLEFRSIDGRGNHQADPGLGAAGDRLLETLPLAFADGVSAPSGADRPNPRAISNAVIAQTTTPANSNGLNLLFVLWGQFLDHDLGLTPGGLPQTLKVLMDGSTSRPAASGALTTLLGRPIEVGAHNRLPASIVVPARGGLDLALAAAADDVGRRGALERFLDADPGSTIPTSPAARSVVTSRLRR